MPELCTGIRAPRPGVLEVIEIRTSEAVERIYEPTADDFDRICREHGLGYHALMDVIKKRQPGDYMILLDIEQYKRYLHEQEAAEVRHALLGNKASRKYKLLREEFPAIFRFNGMLFMEEFDIDRNEHKWIEISPEYAERWLMARRP